MKYNIPFNKPTRTDELITHLSSAAKGTKWSGDGQYTTKTIELLKKHLSVDSLLLTPSCTSSLELSALLLEIKPDDEVIVPSFTFVSTANAFVLRGAKIIFADISEDTLNIDGNKLGNLVTKKTKAIVPVHYAGVACDMDNIMKIANSQNISVVEDAAQALFAKYKNSFLGSIGDMGTFSFHDTKNFTSGEGGALSINNKKFVERAEIIREKGTNRSKFVRGEIDKYTWVDIGSSYLLSDILSAVLYSQLVNKEKILKKRKKLWTNYSTNLKVWAAKSGVRLPYIPEYSEPSYHIFYLLMPNQETRDSLIYFLKEKSIQATFHYQPLHSSKFGKKYGQSTSCPVTEDVARRLIRLPLYYNLTNKEQEYVIEEITQFKL